MRECARGDRRARSPRPRPTRSSTSLRRWRATTCSPTDAALVEALRREGADWAEDEARELGALCGLPQTIRWGVEANQNPPKLRTHDRFGNRIDEVEFHPAWHELMRIGIGHGLHALPWRQPQPGAHVARGALFMLLGQVEAGVGCPISMTYSVIPALRTQPELAAEWEPRFLSLSYDGERLVPAPDKKGALCGMGDDREAGRLRRARQHHHRPAPERRRAGRRVRDHRTQVVLLGADVRRVPRPRPGRRRPVVLPAPPLHARRRAQPHPPPATQGQARQPLQRLLRGRVPGRLGAARRRGGARRADDHRDGQPHPPRLRPGRGRGHALGHRGGDPPLHLSGGVRQAAGGAAADAKRARRPGDRIGGGDGRRDADRARLRRGARRRRGRGRVPAARDPGAQVLDLQARPGPRGRGPGVPGRQRLRGGVGDAAPLPREPARLDLGGIGERAMPRRRGTADPSKLGELRRLTTPVLKY